MNKNVARFIAGPLVAAGMAAGALGLAAAANADDPVQAAPDLFFGAQRSDLRERALH